MIKIILIFAIIRLALNLINKPSYGVLSCGIFACTADDPTKVNINKLKILGIFNDKRGGHSCGISIDGDVFIGTYKDKLFKDYITTYEVIGPDVVPHVIGHTRYATGGDHNIDNAHPFVFGASEYNPDLPQFIGCHNGSLKNTDDIAKKYNITREIKVTMKDSFRMRTKIDSEVLLESIYDGNLDVLEYYNGAAALMWHHEDKPDTFYAYHGKSKTYENGVIEAEERPLYYYQEQDGVLYISSMEDSLDAINDTGGEVLEFKHNTLYEIKNGNVEAAKLTEFDRSANWQKDTTSNAYAGRTNNFTPAKTTSKPVVTLDDEHKKLINVNWSNGLLFTDLRYQKGGNSRLDGVYYLTKALTVIYLDRDESKAKHDYSKLATKPYDKPILLYFRDGIRLKTELDYKMIKDTNDFKTKTIYQLSHMAVHPIKELSYNGAIWKDGMTFTGGFTPLLNKVEYTFNNGKVLDAELSVSTPTILKEDLAILKLAGEEKDMSEYEIAQELCRETLGFTIETCKESVESLDISNTSEYYKVIAALDKVKSFIKNVL